MMVETRQQRPEHAGRVADERGVDRAAQADALGVELDLDELGLAGLRVELDVGEARADDQQRVAALQRVLRRRGAEKAGAAGRVRVVVGQHALAEQRLRHRRAEPLGDRLDLGAGVERAAPGHDHDLLALVQDRGGARELVLGRHMRALGHQVRDMVRDVALRTVVGGHLLGLRVDRHGDVSDAPVGERRAAGEFDDVLGVGRTHDAAVIDAHVHEQLVELDILLGVGVQQIMVLKARDGDDGLAVELSVVETVEEVDAAGTRGGNAGAEPSRPLGVGAGHEGGGLLVAHLDEADLLLLLPQRLDDAVDAVAGDAENRVDAPVDQGVNQNVRRRGGHKGSPPRVQSQSAGELRPGALAVRSYSTRKGPD